MLKPDPIGGLDFLSGVLMFHTASPVPELFAVSHASFLLFKGGGTLLKFPIFPLPIFIIGGAADIVSGAILITGNPAFLGGYKEIIAGALIVKGSLSLVTFMG